MDTSQELVNERAKAARSYNLLPIPSFLRSLKWVADGAHHLFCQKSNLILSHLFFWTKINYFKTLPENLLVKVLSCPWSIFETNQLLVSTPTANRSSPFVNLEQTIEQTESLQRNSCWKILSYVRWQSHNLFVLSLLIKHSVL